MDLAAGFATIAGAAAGGAAAAAWRTWARTLPQESPRQLLLVVGLVLASGNAAYNYRWINNNDVKYGGIRWTAYGNTADSSDEFQW